MNFKNILNLPLLEETDWDDPTERYWDRHIAEPVKIEKEKLYSKPIEPLKQEDLVYIKCITKPIYGSQKATETYLTNKKEFPHTYYKEKAFKFPLSKAEKFVDNHPKETKQHPLLKGDKYKYEIHFEIEQV